VDVGSDIPQGAHLSEGRVVEGHACGYRWGYFGWSSLGSRYQRAYQQLEMAAGGDLIVDVAIRESYLIPVEGIRICTDLRARAVQIVGQGERVQASTADLAAPVIPGPTLTFAKGSIARLKSAAQVRARPRAGGVAVALDPAAALRLGADVRNEEGHWWYVTAAGKAGWILEGDLAAPKP
jgi:hypothetical protein